MEKSAGVGLASAFERSHVRLRALDIIVHCWHYLAHEGDPTLGAGSVSSWNSFFVQYSHLSAPLPLPRLSKDILTSWRASGIIVPVLRSAERREE
jgi:hypothetical protein